jgi:hypothetical protein
VSGVSDSHINVTESLPSTGLELVLVMKDLGNSAVQISERKWFCVVSVIPAEASSL